MKLSAASARDGERADGRERGHDETSQRQAHRILQEDHLAEARVECGTASAIARALVGRAL